MSERKKYREFKPEWEVVPPPEKSFRSLFKWGNPEGFKEPNERLYKLMKKSFGLTDEDFREKINTGTGDVPEGRPVSLDKDVLAFFKDLLGEENVKTDIYSRLGVAYGKNHVRLLPNA